MVGYPEEAMGFLTTGGSLANWTGLVTARRERLPDDFLDGTIYAGDQVHHAVVKSAVLAGFPADNVRLDTLPAGRFAVLRFKGSQKSAAPGKALNELRSLLDEKNLTPSGPPRFAYYDPPWTPQSLRRNEVMLRIGSE